MKQTTLKILPLAIIITVLLANIAWADDPLPSWNDGMAKQSIVHFVAKVTKEGGPDFVPPAERIATFDNDGTLWAEQPLPFQFLFALDRVKALAPQHPEWKDKEPFASLLKGNLKGALAGGEKAIAGNYDRHAFRHDHSGIRADRQGLALHSETSEDQAAVHRAWSINPCSNCSLTCVRTDSKPSSFPAAASSSCGILHEKVYGIPPDQVIGSSGKLKFELRDGKPVLVQVARN